MLIAMWVATPALAAEATKPSSRAGSAIWRPWIATGYDLFINTYSLAEKDTTETIEEATFLMGFSGRSPGHRHRTWRLGGDISSGTELWRESLTGDVRWHDARGHTRLRISGEGRGRQYRRSTDYGLSSDNIEGRCEVRGLPLATRKLQLESRIWARGRQFKIPSTLELDQNEWGLGLALRDGKTRAKAWSLGGRYFQRAYPDSARINRNTYSVIGTWDSQSADQSGLRVYHRSDHRQVADETARPSAWTHWTDINIQKSVASKMIFLELQNEVWRYTGSSDAFQNSWRTSSRLGWKWGDDLATRWRAGLSSEWLHSDDHTESYAQYGLLAGLDTYQNRLAGSLLLEFGRRTFSAADSDELLFDASTSDFNYWKIWLTANWDLGPHFALDLLASYEPERHGEKTDDTTLAFASTRLVWRP